MAVLPSYPPDSHQCANAVYCRTKKISDIIDCNVNKKDQILIAVFGEV